MLRELNENEMMMVSGGNIDGGYESGIPGTEQWDINGDPVNSLGGVGNEVTVYGIRVNGVNIPISEGQFNDITSAASSNFDGGQQLGALIENAITNPLETTGALYDLMINGYADYLYVEEYGAWNALAFMYNTGY